MNTYRLRVELEVDVDSFDESDACEAATDAFGPGDYSGYLVRDMEIVGIKEV
jgi:hypothetical protein